MDALLGMAVFVLTLSIIKIDSLYEMESSLAIKKKVKLDNLLLIE